MTPAPADGILYGAGVAADLPCDRVLQLSEFHPAGHAGFQLLVRVEGDHVVSADPRVGLMHRGAEKLYEARDYRQIMMLANRHDWLSAFSSELGVALAVEAAMGITPPQRATLVRTLLAELNRIYAALSFLAPVATDPRLRQLLLSAREEITGFWETTTGGRVHPMFARLGGVALPLEAGTLAQCRRLLARLTAASGHGSEVAELLRPSHTGLAVLSSRTATAMGASGPVGRASGVDVDLRRDDPYCGYADLADDLEVAVAEAGDAAARYGLLAAQVPTSLRLMERCLDRLVELGPGPVDVPLPKSVRVPEGVGYSWMEGPIGIAGYLLASAGERTPWRLKLRSASFNNAQAMAPALVGVPVDRLADAVMSFFFVVGDIDR